MYLWLTACSATKTTPAEHSAATSTPTHSAAPSGHTGAATCDSGSPVDGTLATFPLPGNTGATDRCWSETGLAPWCDDLGFTGTFGACPTWTQLREAILDGTVTSIGYPLYPATDLEVVTCTRAGGGDWHWLRVYPYAYYDAGSYGLLFDGDDQFAAFAQFPGYFSGGWCCEGGHGWSTWTGVVPPTDWTCDEGVPLAGPSGGSGTSGGSGAR